MKKLAVALLALLWAVPALAQGIGGGPIGIPATVSIAQYFPNVGTTCSTAAFTAQGTSSQIYLPPGSNCTTTIPAATNPYVTWGFGQITTADGNKQAPWNSVIQAAPSASGTWTSIAAAFNGDLSHMNFAAGHRITGATTLGQPNTGFSLVPEAGNVALYTRNDSGWNQNTGSNDGRTSTFNLGTYSYQVGSGGLINIYAQGSVSNAGNKVGATTFLANPSLELYGGTVSAITGGGTFLQPLGDLDCNDNGFDVACMGGVWNFDRTLGTGALGATWMGLRLQSIGTVPIDAFGSNSGPTVIGSDHAAETFPDKTLSSIVMSSGGTGYTVNDILTLSGGTGVDTASQVVVLTVDGSGVILTWAVAQNGKYAITTPSGTVSVTGGTGTGATFTVAYDGNAAITLPQNGAIYGNASVAANIANTKYSNATVLGTDKIRDESTNGWSFYSGGTLQANINSSGTHVATAFFQAVRTVTSSGPFAENATDLILLINRTVGGASTVNLQASPGTGRVFTIKDAKGDAATNPITVNASAGQKIDGAATYTISTNYGFVRMVFDGVNWWVVSKG